MPVSIKCSKVLRNSLAGALMAAIALPLFVGLSATPAEARYCLGDRVVAAGAGGTWASAKYWARRHWRRNARNRFGSCFDSYTLSRDKSWSCHRDGRTRRCEVSARPCSTCGTLYDD